MYTIRNVSKEILWTAIEKMQVSGELKCSCDKCLADILAHALNHMPPIYATHDMTIGIALARVQQRQFMTDVIIAVSQAAQEVSAHPNHENNTYIQASDTGECYLILDQQGMITAATRQSCFLFAATVDALINRPVTKFLEDHPDTSHQLLLEEIQKGIPSAHTSRLLRANGKTCTISYSLSPLGQNGQLTGAILLIRDIDDRNN